MSDKGETDRPLAIPSAMNELERVANRLNERVESLVSKLACVCRELEPSVDGPTSETPSPATEVSGQLCKCCANIDNSTDAIHDLLGRLEL